jgi:cobaltochelatase CobT
MIVDAEEPGGLMMKRITELLDEILDATWSGAAGERAALVM